MGAVCDFCSYPEPTWFFPCAAFPVALMIAPDGSTLEETCTEDWLCCEFCCPFVDREAWGALYQDIARRMEGAPLSEVVLGYWRAFAQYRSGPRRLITPEELDVWGREADEQRTLNQIEFGFFLEKVQEEHPGGDNQ